MAEVEKLVRELKLERKNLRRALTVAVDGYFKCQLSEDKETAYDKVLDKSDRLFKVDSELRSLIEATEAEFDLAETYRDKVIDVRQDFKKHVQESSVSTMVDNKGIVPLSGTIAKKVAKTWRLSRRWLITRKNYH